MSNRYVRFSKAKLKGFEGDKECEITLAVTFHVLLTTCQLMAPFTPFLVETMYQNLKNALVDPPESIHYFAIPDVDEKYIETDVEERFAVLDKVLKLTRQARDQVHEVTSYKVNFKFWNAFEHLRSLHNVGQNFHFHAFDNVPVFHYFLA